MAIQHHTFSNGGHVVHRQTMPGSLCRFSVWYNDMNMVLDIERIDRLHRSYPATAAQRAYFERHLPVCILPIPKRNAWADRA